MCLYLCKKIYLKKFNEQKYFKINEENINAEPK